MKACIIGANGYIGKHLTCYLKKLGWELYLYGSRDESVEAFGNYFKLDIRNKEEVSKIKTDVDCIFFMIGVTGTVRGYQEYELFIDVNEKGLLHLLDLVRSANNKVRIVFPSTRLVYQGANDTPLIENDTKEFKSLYALNKWTGEQLLKQYADYFGVEFTVFRICVPYGNNYSKDYSYGTIGFFISKALRGEPIILFGDGSLKRTFTHIDDICNQIVECIQAKESINEIFNIDGETKSLKEVAALISEKFKIEIIHQEWPTNDYKLESGDTIFNCTKIKSFVKNTLNYSIEGWIFNL